ncbi:MAG: ABC transporter substrate-binding protein [Candidatus Omnitrophota bacterium]|nr:ABC transporter substrate-binding protein [Candidatus Omnitrophota bacterium]
MRHFKKFKIMMKQFKTALILLFAVIFLVSFAYAADTVSIGAIIDCSGKTSDAGGPFANGLEDYFNFINQKGGINGKKVNLIIRDNVYDVNLAMTLYNDLRDAGIISLIGWGTGESVALSVRVNRDHITYLPGSMAESLVDPIQPFVFILSASYEDQFYALLKYAAKHPKVPGRRVRVAFVYNSTPFGKSPIKRAQEMVEQLGMELVGSQIVELIATNADYEMRALISKEPDYIIIQETGPATVAIINSCADTGLKATVMGTFYSGNEVVLTKAKESLKSVEFIVSSPFVRWYESVPGMDEIKAFAAEYRPKVREWSETYIQGWAVAMLYAEVLRLAGESVTRDTFRDTLESIKEFNFKGLMPPISFGPKKHKGGTKVKIYKANIDNMRFEPITSWIE